MEVQRGGKGVMGAIGRGLVASTALPGSGTKYVLVNDPVLHDEMEPVLRVRDEIDVH